MEDKAVTEQSKLMKQIQSEKDDEYVPPVPAAPDSEKEIAANHEMKLQQILTPDMEAWNAKISSLLLLSPNCRSLKTVLRAFVLNSV